MIGAGQDESLRGALRNPRRTDDEFRQWLGRQYDAASVHLDAVRQPLADLRMK
jgi:hypothetical protein